MHAALYLLTRTRSRTTDRQLGTMQLVMAYARTMVRCAAAAIFTKYTVILPAGGFIATYHTDLSMNLYSKYHHRHGSP